MNRQETLIGEIKDLVEEARQLDQAVPSAEDLEKIEKLLADAGAKKTELDRLKGQQDRRDQFAQLSSELGLAEPTATNGYNHVAKGKTIGQTFVESEQYKDFISKYPEGRIPDQTHVAVAPVRYKELISITGDETGGAQGLVPPDYQGLVDMLGRPELVLRSLVSTRTTTSDLIEYVCQLARINAADFVPEAKSTDDADAIKPEGGFTFKVVREPVRTLAEWIPLTKRALMDAAQLRGIVDQELRGDLDEGEERAMLTGDGTGENLTGLESVEGTQEQSFDTDPFVTTRKARTLVRFVGRATPTAYVMNPVDDEAIDLARDGMERFYGNGPFGMGPQTLWGLPRVVSEFVPEGTAWVGDWSRAVIWDRQQSSISVTDSHADFFVRNLVAVLGERRLAFGVIRPPAFVKIELAES